MPKRIRSKYPIDSTGLSEKLKNLRLDKDEDNDLPALPIIPFNVYQNPSKAQMPVVICDPTAATTMVAANNVSAGINASTQVCLNVAAKNMLYNPTSGYNEETRTPTVFKNITALNNGDTAIWTSAATKKWRLMGICVTLMKATTAAGASKLRIYDVAADTGIGVDICAGAMTAAPGGLILLQGSFGNGILAAAANTALNANLSSALAAGGVSIQVWGTEE